jgi:hypothetical protein
LHFSAFVTFRFIAATTDEDDDVVDAVDKSVNGTVTISSNTHIGTIGSNSVECCNTFGPMMVAIALPQLPLPIIQTLSFIVLR